MGATCREDKIEMITDIAKFYRRTGLLCYEDLEWMGLEVKNAAGIFYSTQVELILDFCVNNPEYHIATMTHPGRIENRYVAGYNTYLIGNGDKKEHIVLNPFMAEDPHLFMEQIQNEALAIIADINSSNKMK